MPRRWLLLVAGLVWAGVAATLCGRAAGWLGSTDGTTGNILLGAAALTAGTGYGFGFRRIVERNANRIAGLPEKVCMFAFTPWRGYIMIIGMVTMGYLLRTSPLPKVYLILPYSAMGMVLLLGSIGFIRRFFARQ